jgi:3-methyladenine DNA glycosylase/8-oxoguanine DNA glycosylase
MAKALCELQSELAGNIVKHPTKIGLKRKQQATQKQSKVNKNCSNPQLLEDNIIRVQALGNFPSSKELATLKVKDKDKEDFLQKRCNLGLRAHYIIEFAVRVESGKLNLKKFEEAFGRASSYKEIYKKLKKINGFGSYVCANLMMCIGFYQMVPVDSETKRHLQQV